MNINYTRNLKVYRLNRSCFHQNCVSKELLYTRNHTPRQHLSWYWRTYFNLNQTLTLTKSFQFHKYKKYRELIIEVLAIKYSTITLSAVWKIKWECLSFNLQTKKRHLCSHKMLELLPTRKIIYQTKKLPSSKQI